MPLILIIDDEEFAREGFKRILTKEGYEIALASSGEEALSLLEKIKPDIILLDFRMPGLDGLEVCRRIRSEEKTKAIPIVMITGYPGEKENAVRAGADDFLNKPINAIDVIMRIKCLLKIGKLTDELERTKAYLEELRIVEEKKKKEE